MLTDVASWVAIILSGLAIFKQVQDFFKNHKREKLAVEAALDKAPIVKQSLELGNLGEAVTHLNAIIVSQAAHRDRQDREIAHLQDRNRALEADNDALGRRVGELESMVNQLTNLLDQERQGNNNEPDPV